MRNPRLLDLFCGEGGASAGYAEAGFEVVGVAIEPQPTYPFEFHQADALTFPLDGFDVYAGSPPCTGHSSMANVGGFHGTHGTEWMLPATIQRLAGTGKPYVVENVAAADLPGALTLCGSEFNLTDGPYTLRRHRQFVSNVFLWAAGGCRCAGRRIIGVYGELSRNDRPATSRRRADGRPHGDMRAGVTEFIGEQLLDALTRDLAVSATRPYPTDVPKEVTR